MLIPRIFSLFPVLLVYPFLSWFVAFYTYANAIDRQKYSLGGILILLLLYEIWFGYLPAMAQIEPGFNHGYSVISFAVIYLLARYIRLYGIAKWIRKSSLTIYVICSVFIGFEAYILLYRYSGSVHNVSNVINFIAYSYCNPLVILSSVAFFLTFEKMEIGYLKVINSVAQSVLAVLLIHSSSTLNPQMKLYFRNILYEGNYGGIVVFLWVLGILGIFIISILIDSVRIYFYKLVGQWLVAKANLLVNKISNNLK